MSKRPVTERHKAVAASGIARWFCRTGFGRFIWAGVLGMPAHEPRPEDADEAPSPLGVATASPATVDRLLAAAPQGKLVVVNRKRNPVWPWLQGLAAVALVIVIIAAFRVVTFGLTPAQQQAPAQAGDTFPWTSASGVAERFVSTYYTFNETAPKQRTDALAGIVPAGVDVSAGDAHGVTRATDASAVATSTVGGSRFVTVSFTYWVYALKGSDWQPTGSQRLDASVPVGVVNGTIVPTGAPALVPEPSQGTVSRQPAGVDSALTSATADFGTAFFQTLYSDRDLSALTAPGTDLSSLKIPGASLDSVTSWQVANGTGDHRQASAVAKVKLGTATWTQRYQLDLVKAVAGNGDRWLVAGLTSAG